MLLETLFFRELPYLSERFVDIEQESARVLAESVIYSDIDPFFEFPPQAYAVVGEGVPHLNFSNEGNTLPAPPHTTQPIRRQIFCRSSTWRVIISLSLYCPS